MATKANAKSTPPKAEESLTTQALRWMGADPSRTQAEAARKFGINESTISRAIARRCAKETCPCCGQVIRTPRKRN